MMSTICDVHCHFFSSRFLEILVASDQQRLPAAEHANVIAGLLGWEPPSTPENLGMIGKVKYMLQIEEA